MRKSEKLLLLRMLVVECATVEGEAGLGEGEEAGVAEHHYLL